MPTAVMTESNEKIQQHDLNNDAPEGASNLCGDLTLLPFQLLMDLMHTLPDQEESTDKQDQVAARNFKAEYGEEGFGKANDPAQGKQKQDAGDYGQHNAGRPGPLLLLLRKLARQNRNKDNVIYT
jgi:hypothetical protein